MKKREPFPSIECFRIYLSHSPDDNEAKFYFSKCLEYEENPDWYMENYELEKLKEAEEANNEGKQDVVTRDVNLDDKLSFDDSNSKNNVNSDYHSNVSDDHLESVKSFESYNALKNNNNSSSISNDNRKNSDNYNNKSTSNNRIDELNSVTNANNYNMMSETFDDNVLND